MKDFYRILGLNRNCSTQDIKSAYRRLAQEWHPDKNKSSNAHEKFIEIHEAYEFLSNPDKRKFYDSLHNTETKKDIVASPKSTQQQRQTYEKFEKEAHMKAEYYSRVSFDKYFTDFLSGIDKVQRGCGYIFSVGWAIFFMICGGYGLILYFKGLFMVEKLVLWRMLVFGTLLLVVSCLFIYAGYKIIKWALKAVG